MQSCRSSLLVKVPVCVVGAFAGAGLLCHGKFKENLWRRGVQPGVSRDFPWSVVSPRHAFLAAAGSMLLR